MGFLGDTFNGIGQTALHPLQALSNAMRSAGQQTINGVGQIGNDINQITDAYNSPQLDSLTKIERMVGKSVDTARDTVFLPAQPLGGALSGLPATAPTMNALGHGYGFLNNQLNNLYGTENSPGAFQKSINDLGVSNPVTNLSAGFMREAGRPIANADMQYGGVNLMTQLAQAMAPATPEPNVSDMPAIKGLAPGDPFGTNLSDVLHHPALYTVYPELQNMPVYTLDLGDVQGAYIPNDGIALNNSLIGSGDEMPVLLHEIQHAIQHVNGRDVQPSANFGDYVNSPLEMDARRFNYADANNPTSPLYHH